MTAKEKAIELYNKFQFMWILKEDSKQCALICVDEILEFHDRIDVKYWTEVKQEINKL